MSLSSEVLTDIRAAETRCEAERLLGSLGIEGVAREVILRATGKLRHENRVARVLEVAQHNKAHLLGLVVLDLAGVGGPRFDGFAAETGTARVPELATLGKGRKYASDGGAWDAAIQTAVSRTIDGAVNITPTEHGVRFMMGEDVWETGPEHRPWVMQLVRRYLCTIALDQEVPRILLSMREIPLTRWAELYNRLGG